MIKLLSPKFVFFLLVSFLCITVSAVAQDDPNPDANRPQFDRGRPGGRPNLFRALGLTPEQVEKIRQLNQARRPLMEAALVRLRDANRALDDAIYADSFDENVFKTRLKDQQAAQAEVAHLRFEGELDVRKVLTPEQLAKFRQLRMQYRPARDDRPGPPADDKMRPMQHFRRGEHPPI